MRFFSFAFFIPVTLRASPIRTISHMFSPGGQFQKGLLNKGVNYEFLNSKAAYPWVWQKKWQQSDPTNLSGVLSLTTTQNSEPSSWWEKEKAERFTSGHKVGVDTLPGWRMGYQVERIEPVFHCGYWEVANPHRTAFVTMHLESKLDGMR